MICYQHDIKYYQYCCKYHARRTRTHGGMVGLIGDRGYSY